MSSTQVPRYFVQPYQNQFSAIDSIFSNAKNPVMIFYDDRLHTFDNWPKQIRPDKYSLAKAGFYYSGLSDKVTCFACGVNVGKWEPTDDPWQEHKRWSKDCMLVKMIGVSQQPSIDIPPKYSYGSNFFVKPMPK